MEKKEGGHNVVMGNVRVELGAGVSGNVHASAAPLAEILETAAGIWEAVGRSGVAPDDDAGNDRLLRDLQRAHNEFAVSYPVPLRWMVQAREYDPRAFEAFLRQHVKAFYKDRSEFLDAQGEYLTLLFKNRNPQATSRQIRRYRADVQKSLKKEDEAFTDAWREAEAEVRRIDEEADSDRRRRLYYHCRRLQPDAPACQNNAGANGAPP
jgi:hypothetical protein